MPEFVRVIDGPYTGLFGRWVVLPKGYILIEHTDRGQTVLTMVRKDNTDA